MRSSRIHLIVFRSLSVFWVQLFFLILILNCSKFLILLQYSLIITSQQWVDPPSYLDQHLGSNLGLNSPNFRPKMFGEHKKPSLVVKYHRKKSYRILDQILAQMALKWLLVVKNHWNQPECAISDNWYGSKSRYLPKTRFLTHLGPNLGRETVYLS